MSNRAASDIAPTSTSRFTASAAETPTLTPSSTPSNTPTRPSPVPITSFRDSRSNVRMDDTVKDQAAPAAERQQHEEPTTTVTATEQTRQTDNTKPALTKKKSKCKRSDHKKKPTASKSTQKKGVKDDSSDDDSSESSEETASATSSEESSSEEEMKKKRKSKKVKVSKKAKGTKRRKAKKHETEDDTEDADTESEDGSSEEEVPTRKKKSSKKAKKLPEPDSDEDEEDEDSDDEDPLDDLKTQMEDLKLKLASQKAKRRKASKKSSKGKRKSKKGASTHFRRVDQVWDRETHNYKLKDSAEHDDSEFAEYSFLVRRRLDWEGRLIETEVDIKNKQLRTVLIEIMKDCRSVSLEAEEPTVDPNTLFLYLEELRTHFKKTLKTRIKAEKKRKIIKLLEQQRTLCKSLVRYIDEDYANTKKTLYPLLEAGNITFELLWALFKPGEIALTSTYGHWDEPRCFQVEYANKYSTMTRGEWYCVEGKYMEYDGKNFGLGDFEIDQDGFKGPRKITSLTTYPLRYNKNADAIKKQIITRGKSFVEMGGMNYRFHKGIAFMKKKKQILKININGRVMIDPGTFRRINPNYSIAFIKPGESEDLFSDSEDDDEDSDDCCCCSDDDEKKPSGVAGEVLIQDDNDNDKPKTKYKWVKDKNGEHALVGVEVDADGEPIRRNTVEQLESSTKRNFTDAELLLTSSVVLGFAFSEKLWLEFSLSGVKDIEYNEAAFESLVLPPNQKSIVRALVESHKFNAAKTIDDVVQGKGKGLVSVLHGPPGTGKTLTAEGISELLKCPLYMVSAGELGTDPGRLEHELQKILDIAHSWGAVLLLDEADVFLEKREVHDIHRNALVSIFLRLLEYFQGILFLTTNRVETFDDAFQSRIHVALRYGELTHKAKKTIWNMFLEKCRQQEGTEVADFSDHELEVLSRNSLNGRQIKNIVRTAQALALNEKTMLGMEHIKRVLDVAESFDRDLKGGTGYVDAMRSYT